MFNKIKISISKMLNKLKISVSGFVTNFFTLKKIAFLLGLMFLSALVKYANKLDTSSNLFIILMTAFLLFGIWYYSKKDTEITNYSQLSIREDINKKCSIYITSIVIMIIYNEFNVPEILKAYVIEIFINDVIVYGLGVIISFVLLWGLLISVKYLSRYYGKEAMFAVFFGILYMGLSLMLNLSNAVTIMGSIGTMDMYLHKEQYLFAISLQCLLIRYFIRRIDFKSQIKYLIKSAL